MAKLKTIDLFAGIGGVRKAFEKSGFETAYANDIDKDCKTTYDINFKEPKLDRDDVWNALKRGFPKFDVLLAGFPCQAFSIAGYRKGFEDEKGRGNAFFAIAQILKKYRPKAFLLENVKNLYSHDKKRTFNKIKGVLEKDLGYFIDSRILNTMEYGNIPQNRERIYIVGFKKIDDLYNFAWPEKIRLSIKLADILEKKVDKKYYYEDKPLYKRIKTYPFKENGIYQWRRKYVRENKKGVCPTLTANMGTGGHNVPLIKDSNGIRKLTPRECARLQGFPDSFNFPSELPDSKIYKQIGNSITITVVNRIAKNMEKVLRIPKHKKNAKLQIESSYVPANQFAGFNR